MAIDKLIVKFFATEPPERIADAIDVFHRWIQDDSIDGLPLDVADYAHVPDGPGIILIGHEADHALDETEGPVGYMYRRKRLLAGSDEERVLACFKAAVAAAAKLSEDPKLGLKLDLSRVRLVFNDRLAQPNTDAGWDAVSAAVQAAVSKAYGGADLMVERDAGDPRARLGVTIGVAGDHSLASLAGNLV
ncbi:MAG: hypothetical protein PF961_12255 [Planctomycetota bacterium]|jgi:hypothetical protein|nr:hypothetical protein [Planctomycetota bacterium]